MRDDELYHYRTKGSKNGVSTDPNYTPIGQRAQGPAYMPGSTANRQYREQQQQVARLQADAAIKRAKSSATATANSFISGVNSAASKAATLAEDAAIRRDLARREKEKKKEEERQARREMIERGIDNLKKSTISGVNSALQKTGANLRIGKRGVTNPYEQGYTGVTRSRAGVGDRAKWRQERIKQYHEDTKAGKYGKIAAAKAYGKEGLDAATRLAKQAKQTLTPSNLRSKYYKAQYNLSRDIDDLKRDVTASDNYKRIKSGVTKAASAAKSTMDKAQKKANDLYERSKPGIDEAKTRVKEKASEAADSVGAEAERLKNKGLDLLKKLRK